MYIVNMQGKKKKKNQEAFRERRHLHFCDFDFELWPWT